MSPIDKIPTLGLGGDDEVAIAREVVRMDVDIRLGKKERRLINRGISRKDGWMYQQASQSTLAVSPLCPTLLAGKPKGESQPRHVIGILPPRTRCEVLGHGD